MKRIIITAPLLTLLIATASCVQPAKPMTSDQEQQWSATPTADVYEATLDHLLPGMGSEDLAEREQTQKEFEAIGLKLGKPGMEEACSAFCLTITKRLGPETPTLARVWMIRQLERIGGDESVPTLRQLLDDQDPQIRELSRRALQHNPAPSAGKALRGAFRRATDPAGRIALMNALAARRDQTILPRLTRLAQAKNPDVTAAAIAALGDMDAGSRIIKTLHSLRRKVDAGLRDQVEATLLRCGERLLGEDERGKAAKIFESLYDSKTTPQIRIGALRGLTLAKREGALPSLFALMRGDDPKMRDLAARFALEIRGETITRTLAAVLPHLPPAAQATLLDGLGERGDLAAQPATLKAAESAEDEVRIAALRALRHLGDSSTVILLATAAAEDSGPQREAARESLSLLRGEDVDDVMLAAMQEQTDAALRRELIRGLAARRCRPAVPALFTASEDQDEIVRVAAFDALGSLAGEDDLTALVARLLNVEGSDARQAAENAVVETAARIADPSQRADPVLAVLDQTDGPVRVSLIRVLGRIGGAGALEAIRAETSASDPDVTDAVVRALAGWPDPEVTDDLLYIARTSSEQTHRVLALRGYVRLVRLPSERQPVDTFKMLDQAMALATRPDEKKLVLGGLAEVRHLDALMLAELQLGDEALRDEAAACMLTIARALAAEQHDAALAAIDKVNATPTSDKVHQQANETTKFIERFEGYSATWLISGPYLAEGRKFEDMFETVFPPESTGAPDVAWGPLAINNRDNPWVFLLDKAIGGSNRCVYVRTDIWSDQQQPASLQIGSDDAVKAWLNGQLVHTKLTVRPVTPAEDKATVTLNQGWNTLMLKIVQGGGGWGFCAGFKNPDGGKLEGLKFRAK